MAVTLQPVFDALGYRGEAAQRALVQLLQASGAFGDLPCADGVIDNRQADAILSHVTFDSSAQAAQWLHAVTQEFMIGRPPGVERHACEEPEHFRKHRSRLLDALRAAGMLPEIKPAGKQYDHVLLLGAMEPELDSRLDMLPKLWNEGVRFKQIHLLGSERPLLPGHEPMAQIAIDGGGQGTEMQMMIVRAYEKSAGWPVDLQQVRLHSVSAPASEQGRANTRDTAVAWLKTQPEPGNVLVISGQPCAAYQDAAVKSVLPSLVPVETIGAAAEDNVKVSVCMDSLARQIDVGFPRLLEKLAAQPAPLATPIITIDPARIKVDAATYQFRSGGDARGVTRQGRYQCDRWDPILHGDPLLLHERRDGSLFVADGHHRLDLANRLNARGKGPGSLLAMVLSEKDGYSAQDVRVIAAYKNIAHGTTDPVETARVFKEAHSGKINLDLLPHLQMDKGNLRLSYSLSKLSDATLDKVAKGEIPVEIAAQVAALPSDARGERETTVGHPSEAPGFAARLKQERAHAVAGHFNSL